MQRILSTAVIAGALALAGCTQQSADTAQKAPEKTAEKTAEGKKYPMKGEIKSLDANAKSAAIDAGPIGDWMGAMTMDYPIKPDAEFQKLHVGDKIEATVVVNDPAYYVTDIKVLPK